MAHRQRRAALDAGGAVADHPVELAAQLPDDRGDAVLGQRVLVASLRGRQQPERLEPLVANEGLRELGDALDDIHDIEHDAAFRSHHQIEVAQPDIEIDHRDLLTSLCKGGAERGSRRRLAYAAFTRGDDNDLGHVYDVPHLESQFDVASCPERANALDALSGEVTCSTGFRTPDARPGGCKLSRS